MADGTIPTTETFARGFAARLPECVPQWPAATPNLWLARAYGTLDVMGGIAEYTGALTLSTPIAQAVQVAVAPRDDQRLRVVCLSEDTPSTAHEGNGNGRLAEVDWPLSDFYSPDGSILSAEELRRRGAELACPVRVAALAIAHVLLSAGIVPHLGGGFTVVVDSRIPGQGGLRKTAAEQAAVLAALLPALGIDLETQRWAVLSQQAHACGGGWPAGIATHAGSVFAQPGRLVEVRCRPIEGRPLEVGSAIEIPVGVTFLGIDCGARHPHAARKYVQARTAALMGAEIVRRLLEAEGGTWEGFLTQVSVTEYVDRLRDKLPTKLQGSQYLERFGPLDDPFAPIEPNILYKVRSRAEHHIYENDRVRQFAERLARAARTGDDQTLAEAGELMYASHWSYGQRCGLGGVPTDLLVNLLRREAPAAGILGARVSEEGAGGTVVVFLRDTPQAQAAVEHAVRSYEQHTRHKAAILPAAKTGEPGIAVEAHSST